jgi:hypothetical protein
MNMNHHVWATVLIDAGFFIVFAFSFTRPRTKTDWRSFGAFSAFIVALFAEMYGFPLTIYLLSGWLARRYPGIDPFSHDFGHLFHTLLGLKGDPHMDPFHILSNVLIVFGLYLLAVSWRALYTAQKLPTLATAGPYAYVGSAIRGIHSDNARLPPTVADDSDARDVSGARLDVCATGEDRASTDAREVRRPLR